jgi:transcriptional regulator with XRE-family HTH domain
MHQVYSPCTFKSTHSRPLFLEVYVPCVMTIGTRLRAARQAAGLTQSQVGEALITNEKPNGFEKQTVASWEKNRNNLQADLIILLCALLKISPNYLLLGKDSELSETELWILTAHRRANAGRKRAIESAVAAMVSEDLAGNEISNSPAIAIK